MRRSALHIGLLAALLFCAQRVAAQDVVAEVEDEQITAAEFVSRYAGFILKAGVADDPRLRMQVLDGMIDERLLIADARAHGLDGTPAFAEFAERVQEKLLIESYIDRHVTSRVAVTDGDLEEAFIRMNTELTARHLYARTREEALALRERVEAGETFEMLAAEVFGDPALAAAGGSVGTFTYDEMDQDFEDAAFALQVGDVSGPVRTAQGYSIIQVTDRFTKPLITETEFAQRKDKLRALVLRKKRLSARTHAAREAADRLQVTFHPAFDRLLGQLQGVSLIADEAMAAFLDEPLLSYSTEAGRATWTVERFREVAADTDPAQRGQVRTAADLKEFASGLVVRSHLIEAAREAELDTTAAYRQAQASALERWILDARRAQIMAAVVVHEDSIRAHYRQYPTEFIAPAGTSRPLEEVRPIIEEQLRERLGRMALAEVAADLREEAEVRVDRDVLLGVSIGAQAPIDGPGISTAEYARTDAVPGDAFAGIDLGDGGERAVPGDADEGVDGPPAANLDEAVEGAGERARAGSKHGRRTGAAHGDTPSSQAARPATKNESGR